MSMQISSNGPEAAYSSFALIDALGELLINKTIITQQEWDAVSSIAAAELQAANNSEAKRAGDFIQQSSKP
jgi:hypothetical protein